MYLCILDQAGEVLLHKDFRANPDACLKAVANYREDLVVAVECIFTWYWLADLWRSEGINFVLGHALYMKAIHGGKAKNDRIDAHKVAVILRGGMLPQAYVYPPEMRATRDLLRRRLHFTRKRAELLAHIENTNSQHNLPVFQKKLTYPSNRGEASGRFSDLAVQQNIDVDHHARHPQQDIFPLYRLRTIPPGSFNHWIRSRLRAIYPYSLASLLHRSYHGII